MEKGGGQRWKDQPTAPPPEPQGCNPPATLSALHLAVLEPGIPQHPLTLPPPLALFPRWTALSVPGLRWRLSGIELCLSPLCVELGRYLHISIQVQQPPFRREGWAQNPRLGAGPGTNHWWLEANVVLLPCQPAAGFAWEGKKQALRAGRPAGDWTAVGSRNEGGHPARGSLAPESRLLPWRNKRLLTAWMPPGWTPACAGPAGRWVPVAQEPDLLPGSLGRTRRPVGECLSLFCHFPQPLRSLCSHRERLSTRHQEGHPTDQRGQRDLQPQVLIWKSVPDGEDPPPFCWWPWPPGSSEKMPRHQLHHILAAWLGQTTWPLYRQRTSLKVLS